DRFEIAQALQRRETTTARRGRELSAQNLRRNLCACTHACAHEKPRAKRIERRERCYRRNGDNGEENERLFAAAGEDPVIDFQHVKGCRQRQHGHRRAEENRVCEQPPARRNGLEQEIWFGFRDRSLRLQQLSPPRAGRELSWLL